MIQDIYPRKIDNSFKDNTPSDRDLIMAFSNGKILVRYDEMERRIIFPEWKHDFKDLENHYLFSIDDMRYFLVFDFTDIPNNFTYYSLQELRKFDLNANDDIFAAYTGYHLWRWYSTSRFCGACGTKNIFDKTERAMVCPECGNRIYPRINPAVIVGIINGDKLLLTKYRVGYAHNALVAGFTEIGESVEETVRREVMEEVVLKVKNIRYYESQPWGMASDILMGYFCEVDGDDDIFMDESELKYAEWVYREDIVLQPSDYSLTNEMMKIFKENKINIGR